MSGPARPSIEEATGEAIRYLGPSLTPITTRVALRFLTTERMVRPPQPHYTAALACIFGAAIDCGILLTFTDVSARVADDTEDGRQRIYEASIYPLAWVLAEWLAETEGDRAKADYFTELVANLVDFVRGEIGRS